MFELFVGLVWLTGAHASPPEIDLEVLDEALAERRRERELLPRYRSCASLEVRLRLRDDFGSEILASASLTPRPPARGAPARGSGRLRPGGRRGP